MAAAVKAGEVVIYFVVQQYDDKTTLTEQMKANTKEGRRSSGGREGWGGSVAPRYNIF